MKIAIACDHAGFPLKATVIEVIRAEGHDVLDIGTDSTASVDYPDFAEKLGHALQVGAAERGILLCGSGVGASIAANKLNGVYAGVCHDTYSAHQAVEHDDMNILCLGGRIIGGALAIALVDGFIASEFSREERHQRRLDKVLALEQK